MQQARGPFWRPITAIRAGETDANSRTVENPNWSPDRPATPNHPEYSSAHACITPAGGRVVARYLRSPRIVRDLDNEVTNARIWGGIHCRSAAEDGAVIARRVANWVLAHHFRRSSQ